MESNIVVPMRLKVKFQQDWLEKQIMVFSAFGGFGKTAVVKKLLEKKKYYMRDVGTDEIESGKILYGLEAVVYDQVHLLKNVEEQHAICEMIYHNPEIHFIFITRGTLPKWLITFQLNEELRVYHSDMLRLNRREIKELMNIRGIEINEEQAEEISQLSFGYPLAIAMFCNYYEDRVLEPSAMMSQIKYNLCQYIEMTVFNTYSKNSRRILLSTAEFEEFSLELIMMLSGHSDIQLEMEQLLEESTVIHLSGNGIYKCIPEFRDFLIWKMKKTYSEKEQKMLQSRAALFYELKNQTNKAIECYIKAEEYLKVMEMLEHNGNLNPWIGQHMEMEAHYRAVPYDVAIQSPSLLCGLSMLESLRANYESSEKWYNELMDYAAKLHKNDAEYVEVQQKLLFLDIALPHRSNESLKKVFPRVLRLIAKHKMELPAFSITTGAISMINGGKDFSDWCKVDDFMYRTMKSTVEAVLGREGVGIAECGLCESKFEKGEDYQKELIQMVSVHMDIQQKGCLDTEVAFHGILARIYISQGKIETARELMSRILSQVQHQEQVEYVANIKALLCHIYLLTGEVHRVEDWCLNDAPSNSLGIWTLWRYQYLTKAEVLIQKTEYLEAILLVSPVLQYTRKCKWKIDEIKCCILLGICFFRLNNEEWKIHLEQALYISKELNFVRTIARYGTAVLPLLKAYGGIKGDKYYGRVLAETKRQASLYQNYLVPNITNREMLTDKELQVLKLICQNKSNAEISEILDIKMPTVKTHISNIFRKLGVKKRSEVKTEARKLELVEEYLLL